MLHIITAFKTEAAPIIDDLSLKPDAVPGKYARYSKPGVRLGICGKGYHNARGIVRYLQSLDVCGNQNEPTVWMNFGIAGSAHWKTGEMVLAGSVMAQSGGKKWIMKNSDILNLPIANICSVDSPQENYQTDLVYDMEAAGIVSRLSDSTPPGRIFLLKLICDGPDMPASALTKSRIQRLIQTRKDDIIAAARILHSAATKCAQII